MANDSTRDRVRALVREVLAKAAPENVAEKDQSSTSTRFVNTISETSTQPAVTRDESAKSVITEDDVRGLEPGAVLRIGEDARLTPLAADIVSEKKIEIVRRASRRGSKAVENRCGRRGPRWVQNEGRTQSGAERSRTQGAGLWSVFRRRR